MRFTKVYVPLTVGYYLAHAGMAVASPAVCWQNKKDSLHLTDFTSSLISLFFTFVECTLPHQPNPFKDSVAFKDLSKEKEKETYLGDFH